MTPQEIETRTALVLGATGGIGGAVADALLTHGWAVRALHRDPARAAKGRDPRIAWIQGDALNASEVRAAAEGCALIVHGVNPPGYRDWDKVVLPMIDNTIAAARASGARVLVPGNIYNFGPDAFPLLKEDAPQAPRSRKGAIRVEMERRLKASGVPVLIVRAGDFFGGRDGGKNWFSMGLVKPGAPLKSIANPGRRGVGHAWAYVPDLAQAMAELVDQPAAETFAVRHFAGHFDPDGTQMAAAIRRAARRELPLKAFPWWLVALAAPFNVTFREVMEMRYLWDEPLRLDNAGLVRALGREPRTPLDQAVRTTLGQLGCLQDPPFSLDGEGTPDLATAAPLPH